MKLPNQFNKEDWNNFYNQLLIQSNYEVFYNYFAKNYTANLNNRGYKNNEFIEAIKAFKHNHQIDKVKSNVCMLDFFYTEDRRRMADLHRTTIYYTDSNEPTVYLVSGYMDFDQNGKINYLFDISYIKSGPQKFLS